MATEALYEIKTHEEAFTDLEIALRRELEAHLPEDMRNYTTEEALNSLKEYRATADTFFPENHFYAFDGEELVGFIHLWPQYSGENNETVGEIATASLPFVRNGKEKVAEQLQSRVLQTAEELGVKTLQLNIDSRDTEQIKRADSLGYQYEDLNRLFARTKVDVLEIESTNSFTITDFDREDHGEAVLDMYEALDISREQISNQFDWISDMGDRVVSWKVALHENRVVGQSIAFVYEGDEQNGQMNVVTRGIDVDDSTYAQVVRDIYTIHLQKLREREVEQVDLNILSSVLELRPVYEELGFTFVQTDSYHLNVE